MGEARVMNIEREIFLDPIQSANCLYGRFLHDLDDAKIGMIHDVIVCLFVLWQDSTNRLS